MLASVSSGRGPVKGTIGALKNLFVFLRVMGIHPTQNFRLFYYPYACVVLFIVCIMAPLTFTMGVLMQRDMPTSQLLTVLQADLNVSGIPIKAVTVAFFMPRFLVTKQFMLQLDARCQHKYEHELIQSMVSMGNRTVNYYSALYFLYGLTGCIMSFCTGQPLFGLYLFVVDWRNSRAEFYCQAVIEFIVVTLCISFQIAQDSYPAIYAYIIRTHMHILVKRVEKLGGQKELSKEESLNELTQCVVDHQCLLGLHKTIAPVVSITMFIQFSVASGILGLTLINIVLYADRTSTIGSVIYLGAVLSQTLPTCYQASSLLEDSQQLPKAIFRCNWPEQDARFRRMCLFFMQHTQTPMKFSALKLFPINLNTNLSIIKFSFSLFTLLGRMDLGAHKDDK